MFSFTAHFYENKIYLNGDFAYVNNQLLTEIIKFQSNEDLILLRKNLIKKSPELRLYSGMEDYIIESYDKEVQSVQQIMSSVDNIFRQLSISQFIATDEQVHTQKLYNVLNTGWFWEFGSESEDNYHDPDFASEFGFNYVDTNKYGDSSVQNYNTRFIPKGLDLTFDESDMIEDLEKINIDIKNLCDAYITFIDDLLRVKHLYIDFVDNYLNAESRFLDSDSLANVFIKFIVKTKNLADKNYLKFTSGYSKFFHTVIKSENKSILCESYEFQSLGAFLYFDLFRGVYNNHIPKKCVNCGNYLLIKAGKYSDYCEQTSPQDKSKTCKEVGSRKKYDDKCKTDPVWQTYNRAYKAHYARYMKKKMTVSEFEKWSAWAVEWRTKAENDEIDFEEYLREIKK